MHLNSRTPAKSALTALLLMLATAVPVFADDVDEEQQVNPWLERTTPELRELRDAIPQIMERDWYQVEVLIFAREQPGDGEYWRLDRYPDYPGASIRTGKAASAEEDGVGIVAEDPPLLPEDADEAHQDALEAGAWLRLGQQHDLQLDEARESMERSRFRTLYHHAWRQPVFERDEARALYVEGGHSMPLALETETLDRLAGDNEQDTVSPETGSEDSDDIPGMDTAPAEQVLEVLLPAEPELRGTLTLSRGRFLHLHPALWFTRESDEGQHFHVDINQHRRMRSGELHYLDHPLFGLLIRLDRWDHPEQVKAELIDEAIEVHEE